MKIVQFTFYRHRGGAAAGRLRRQFQFRTAQSTNGFAGYVNGLGQAKKTADKTIDVSYLNQAVQLFNVQEGRYPKDLQELTPKYVAKIPDAAARLQNHYDATKGEVKVVQQ